MHSHAGIFAALLIVVALASPATADTLVTRGANLAVDVSPADDRIVMDLNGGIWILPASGGEARLAGNGLQQASRPRWSPDGKQVLYQTSSGDGTSLWLLDLATAESSLVSEPAASNQFASFHPQGERIVYSSARDGTDFDLWETDLPTGLSWRLTDQPGDEIEAAWSANGRDLAYIHRLDNRYAIMLRRHGKAAVEIFASEDPLSAISWRPDGTLLTFLRAAEEGTRIEMAILAESPLIREFANGEDYFASPVAWLDRSRLVYPADGMIKYRAFGDWRSKPLPFRALLVDEPARPPRNIPQRQLAVVTPSEEQLVIRGARLFDGIWNHYRDNIDVLVEGGKIAAVVPRQDWPDVTVLDLGSVTILPGFIDSWSRFPAESQANRGAALLAYGVTSIVSDQVPEKFDAAAWESADTPGPRVLPAISLTAAAQPDPAPDYYVASIATLQSSDNDLLAVVRAWQDQGVPVLVDNWKTHRSINADLLLNVESLPRKSLEIRYQDTPGMPVLPDDDAVAVISGLADAATPGLTALLASRQARELGHINPSTRRFSVQPQLANSSATILLGSKPNTLPAGLALHAELRALAAAGLPGEKVLHAAGRNPAKLLGLENQIGTITPGALADLVLVNGNPLENVTDALNIVAVVRNGRFFSLVNLLEQAAITPDVE